MTRQVDVLIAKGVKHPGYTEAGNGLQQICSQALYAGGDVKTTLTDIHNKCGFIEHVWPDGTDEKLSGVGPQDAFWARAIPVLKSFGLVATAPMVAGWNYETFFIPYVASPTGFAPDEQDFCVIDDPANVNQYLVVPNRAFGYYGLVIDAPAVFTFWEQLMANLNSIIGLSNFIGPSDAPTSDHPFISGDAVGWHHTSGTPEFRGSNYNMRTLARYVATAYYLQDVDAAGNHRRNGTACPLWALRGVDPNSFTGVVQSGRMIPDVYGLQIPVPVPGRGIVPTLAMCLDVWNYHKVPDGNYGFGLYLMHANALVEEHIFLQFPQGSSLFRTAATSAKPTLVADLQATYPQFYNYPLDSPGAPPGEAYVRYMRYGMMKADHPYFNFAGLGDNNSNYISGVPGKIGEVASIPTIYEYQLNIRPAWAENPAMFVDTDSFLVQYINSAGQMYPEWLAWTKYGAYSNRMPLASGRFGVEEDALRILIIDQQLQDYRRWPLLANVAHPWGTDQGTGGWNLGAFKVLVGVEDSANFRSAIQAGVSAVGYVDLQNGWGASVNDLLGVSWSLGGGGSAPTVTAAGAASPILAPHLPADINAAYANLRGNATSTRTILAGANVTPLISSSGGGPVAWLSRPFAGGGQILILPLQRSGDGFSSGSGSFGDGIASGTGIFTINGIVYLGGLQGPAMWYPKFVERAPWSAPLDANGQGGYSGLGMHVLGRKGQLKVVWLSNANAFPVNFDLFLSDSFFGFQQPYQLSDVAETSTVLTGTGPVRVTATVPGRAWVVFNAPQVTTTVPTSVTVRASAR